MQLFQTLTHFIIRYLEITFIDVLTYLNGIVFKYWDSVKVMVVETNFPKFSFCLKA